MKWEVNSGVGMPGNGGYKKSKSKGEVSVSSASLIKTIDLMISYVHQIYFFRQIATSLKVHVAFVFGLQPL